MTKHLTLLGHRIFPILLFIGLAWGQNTSGIESDFDKLVSKSGTIYLGEYSRIEKNVVYFKTAKAMASQGVPLNKVHTLQLNDGTIIINSGEINKIDLNNKQDRKLIFKEDKELKPVEMLLLFVTPVALGYLLEFLFWI
jgi:hypothetical protein